MKKRIIQLLETIAENGRLCIAENGRLCAVDTLTFCHEPGISATQKKMIEKYYRDNFSLWWNTWIAPNLREIADQTGDGRFEVKVEYLGKR